MRTCVFVILLLLAMALAQTPEDCAAQNPFVDCAPDGAYSPSDAQYQFSGVTSNLAFGDLSNEIQEAITDETNLPPAAFSTLTYSQLIFNVRFNRYLASSCLIDEEWSISSSVAGRYQCTLAGECGDPASCVGLEHAPVDLTAEVDNLKWGLGMTGARGGMPFQKMTYVRRPAFGELNDDVETGKVTYMTANDDNHSCDCGGSDWTNCDDDNSGDYQCPSLCDDDNSNSCDHAMDLCLPTQPKGEPTVYAFGHKYDVSTSQDRTQADNTDITATQDLTDSEKCDRVLSPNRQFGFTPRDLYDLYWAGDLDSGSLANFGGDPSFWTTKPRGGKRANTNNCDENTTDLDQKLIKQALINGAANKLDPETYSQLATDDNGSITGRFIKDTGYDSYTAPSCGTCGAGQNDPPNLFQYRYITYQVSPECNVYSMADPSTAAPIWDAAIGLSDTTGLLRSLSLDELLNAAPAESLFVSDTDGLVVMQVDVGESAVESAPEGLFSNVDNLVECYPEGTDLFTNSDFPYFDASFDQGPSGCDSETERDCTRGCPGCTPMQQSGRDSQRLWYLLDDLSAQGLTLGCWDPPYSSYAGGGIESSNFKTSNTQFDTSVAGNRINICSDDDEDAARGDNLMCRALEAELSDGTTMYDGAQIFSPGMVAFSFQKFRTDYQAYLEDTTGTVVEPVWTNYQASKFMPLHYVPVPSPNMWLESDVDNTRLLAVPEDDGISSTEDGEVFSFTISLYVASSLVSIGTAPIQLSTFSVDGSTLAGSSSLCPLLDVSPPNCDSSALTYDGELPGGEDPRSACGFTEVFVVFVTESLPPSGDQPAIVRINYEECLAQGFEPFCIAGAPDACQAIVGPQFEVGGGLQQSQFLTNLANGVEVFFDEVAGSELPTCNADCPLVLQQLVGTAWVDVSEVKAVQSCADDIAMTPDQYQQYLDDALCFVSPSSTPSVSATRSITPTSSLSVGESPSTTRTRTVTPSSSVTPSTSASTSFTSTPSMSSSVTTNSTCGFMDPECWCTNSESDSDCYYTPVVLLSIGVLLICCCCIILCIVVGVSEKHKHKQKPKKA